MTKNSKRTTSRIFLSFWIAILVVGFAVNTAINLDNKFFPPDSPILAGFSPNDFLPWGVFFFLALGWGCGDYLLDRSNRDSKFRVFTYIVITVVYIVFYLVNYQLRSLWVESNFQVNWASYISDLNQVWANSWLTGGIIAYYLHPNGYWKQE